MSKWKQVKRNDLEIDGDELNILYDTDSDGNKYLVIKLSDIYEITDLKAKQERKNDG